MNHFNQKNHSSDGFLKSDCYDKRIREIINSKRNEKERQKLRKDA